MKKASSNYGLLSSPVLSVAVGLLKSDRCDGHGCDDKIEIQCRFLYSFKRAMRLCRDRKEP